MLQQKNKYFYLLEQLTELNKTLNNDKNINKQAQLINRHITALRKLIDKSFNLF